MVLIRHLFAIVFLLSCFCPTQSFTQNSSLYFNHLTVNNGLSQGVAAVTLKDSKGFIWISTLDGVDRFDGIDCKHYDLSHLASVNLNQITTNFLEDKNGDIWAGTQHGLLKYNYIQDAFSYIPLNTIGIDNQYSSPDIVRIFHIDNQNRLWLHRENRFYTFNIDKKTSVELQVPNLTRYPVVLISRQPHQPLNNFYITDLSYPSTNIHRVSIINDLPTWKSNTLNSFNLTTASALPNNTLFLAVNNKLYKYDFSTNKPVEFYHLPLNVQINVLTANGPLLWVGTNNEGIVCLNSQTGHVENWLKHSSFSNHSLLFNNISALFIDDAANLWASVWGQGISYTNLSKFRMHHAFTKDEAQSHNCSNFIRSIARDSNGDIWCNTGSNYLIQFDSNLLFKEKIDLPGPFSHFIIDKNDRIWFGLDDHLYNYSITTKKLTRCNNSNHTTPDVFNHLLQLQNGNIVVSCNSGLFLLGKDAMLKPIAGLPLNKNENDYHLINMAFENKKGQLFVGVDRIGMNICEPLPNNTFQIRKSFTFPGNVKCFYEQNDTLLWIATTAGLIQFNQQMEKIERVFTIKDGLPNNFLYACLPDGNGNLWLTSNKGITAFNLHNYHCKNFNVQDGIQSNEFNSFAWLATPDSQLIFGGVNGLNSFRPSSLTSYLHPAKPQITAIKTDSLLNPFAFDPGKPIVLPYNKSSIEIDITALEYANAPSNKVKYILEGNDKEWTISDNKTRIQYAHLDPGNYRFKLMAANCDAFWNNEIKTLNITVLNPFWLTWWFIAACILSVSLGLYLLYRLRLQQVLKMERLRMRLATDLHDDIGATLSSISMYSEAVKNQVKDKLPQLEPVLEKMGENRRKMVSSMSDIVWAVNPENDHGIKLIERMEGYAKDACSVTETRLHFTCHDRLRAISIPLEHRKNNYLIFKEALNNSLKYAAASDIWVTITKDGNLFHLQVKDNGKGFDAQNDYDGNGLKFMRMRAKEIGATITIHSVQGQGTIIDLYSSIS